MSTLTSDDFSSTSLGDPCVGEVITADGQRLLLAEKIATTPQQGINPATFSLTMTAYDAATGASAWTDRILPAQRNVPACASYSATFDGKWAAFKWDLAGADSTLGGQVYDVIDLATGTVYSKPDLVGIVGNYIVTGKVDGDTGTGTYTITQPSAWPQLGTVRFSGSDGSAVLGIGGFGAGDSDPDLSHTGPVSDTANTGATADPAVTPAGTEVVDIYSDDDGNDFFRGYALPSAKLLWGKPGSDVGAGTLAAVTDSVVLVDNAPDSSGSSEDSPNLTALNPKTGKTLWSVDINGGNVCDATSSQVLVTVDSQLATLDAATGKQLSFADNPYETPTGDLGCPQVLGTGLTGVGFSETTSHSCWHPDKPFPVTARIW